jgi:hypothetical protein
MQEPLQAAAALAKVKSEDNATISRLKPTKGATCRDAGAKANFIHLIIIRSSTFIQAYHGRS